MNKTRRMKLAEVFDTLVKLLDTIEAVKAEEQESLENLPDPFRYGERGEEMEGYIEMLEEAYDYLADAQSVIEQI